MATIKSRAPLFICRKACHEPCNSKRKYAMYMHVYINTCIYTQMHVYTCIQIHVQANNIRACMCMLMCAITYGIHTYMLTFESFVYVNVCKCMHKYVHMYECIYACTYVCIHVSVSVSVSLSLCVYMYIYTCP